MTRFALIAGGALAAALLAAPACAERPEDNYWLSGTAMFAKADTTLRLDRSNVSGSGSVISLENDIGLPDHQTLPVVLGGLRLSDHWRVEAEFLRLKREGSAKINRALTIGDTTYSINTSLAGSLASDTYRIGAGYSFVLTDKAELGASIGFHVTRFTTTFVGTGSVNGGGQTALVSTNRGVTAPLPTLGLYGSYSLSPMFSVNGRVDYLSIKIGDIKGKLIDTQAGISARVIKHLSVGGGYRYVDYGVTATKGNFVGKLAYKFNGPVIFAELVF